MTLDIDSILSVSLISSIGYKSEGGGVLRWAKYMVL